MFGNLFFFFSHFTSDYWTICHRADVTLPHLETPYADHTHTCIYIAVAATPWNCAPDDRAFFPPSTFTSELTARKRTAAQALHFRFPSRCSSRRIQDRCLCPCQMSRGISSKIIIRTEAINNVDIRLESCLDRLSFRDRFSCRDSPWPQHRLFEFMNIPDWQPRRKGSTRKRYRVNQGALSEHLKGL